MPTIAETLPSTAALPDRRMSVRLDVLDQLDGRVVMYNIPIRVRDISAGGVATESAIPFPIGSRHLLRFTTADGVEVLIAGKVIHGMAAAMGARRLFLTGFEFVNGKSPKTAGDIERLLDAVRAHVSKN